MIHQINDNLFLTITTLFKEVIKTISYQLTLIIKLTKL